jgi:hypothetical protein
LQLLVIRGQVRKWFYYYSAKFRPRLIAVGAIPPTFPTTLVKGPAECKWANVTIFLSPFSLARPRLLLLLLVLLLYASFMQALSDDLKRIQLHRERKAAFSEFNY